MAVNILTLENKSLDLTNLPDELEEEIRFAILDNSNPLDPDFFFVPLIFLESFNSPAAVLQIGDVSLSVPLEWSIAVGDSRCGKEVEVMPITSLNDRGFEAFLYNPLSSFRHNYASLEIAGIYNDIKWFSPKIRQNQLIAVPLHSYPGSECVFLIKDVTKASEVIDYFKLL